VAAASASQINMAFSALLDTMSKRQQRSARVEASGVVARFVVSDLLDIDQGQTTATVRADTGTATLRERRAPGRVLVSSTAFTSSSGTVQAIDSKGRLFSVYNATGIPKGTFNLTLASLVNISLLTIDISAMASSPSVAVSVSSNGLTWIPATAVSLSGYRLNVWLPDTPTKYIQMVITPSHPDNLGGSTYTFGITDLSGTSVSYNLVGDLFFMPVRVPVQAAQVQLVGDQSPGLTRSLSSPRTHIFARAGRGRRYSAHPDRSLSKQPVPAQRTKQAIYIDGIVTVERWSSSGFSVSFVVQIE